MIKRAIAIGYFTVRKFFLDRLGLTAGPANLLGLREGAQAYSIGSSLAHEKVLGRRRSSRPISGPRRDADLKNIVPQVIEFVHNALTIAI